MGWLEAAADFLGSAYSADQAKRESRRNRQFQEEMSNTAYQRSMRDMKAAGLNPILAAKLGGASSPAGSMAQMPDLGGSISRGIQAGSSALQAQTQEKKADAEIEEIEERTKNYASQRSLNDAQTTQLQELTALVHQQTVSEHQRGRGLSMDNIIRQAVADFVEQNPDSEIVRYFTQSASSAVGGLSNAVRSIFKRTKITKGDTNFYNMRTPQ